jgi:saccharopine dehydrogenase (NAD+, L-lysine-forming)
MTDSDFVIYGANGFTGRLIAERAAERGLRPVLAGRNEAAVAELGKRLGLPHRAFGLASTAEIVDGIGDARLVLHCAGPYSKTSRPMLDACLQAKAHYLDITGEYQVLEATLARGGEASRASIVVLPAVGFDVVPTDCMAKRLSEELPDATRLDLAFSGGLAPSPGTAKTTLENLHVGALVRENGALVALSKPRTLQIPFERGARFGMSIPWGDLVTAYHSTHIPNIAVYTQVPRGLPTAAALSGLFAPILRLPSVVKFLQEKVGARARGPSEEHRKRARMYIYGRVENAAGAVVEGHLDVPEGYELTALAALAATERILAGGVAAGTTTPATAFGSGFVTELPGVPAFRIARA